MKKFACALILLICALSLGAQSAQGTLIVLRGNEDYPPLEMHQNGKLTGFHVDTVNAVAEILGITVEWKEYPWARAMAMIEFGQADAITYISKSPEREKWAIFDERNVLSSGKTGFLVRRDSLDRLIYDGNPTKFLKDKILLVVRDFQIPTIIAEAHVTLEETTSMQQLVDMLLRKRVDIGLLNPDDFANAYKDKPAADILVFLSPPVQEFKNFIAFSRAKKTESMCAIFAKAMDAFAKTPRFAQLKKKYGQ